MSTMAVPYAAFTTRFLKSRYLGTPLTVNFKVTERCNLTCPMCGIPRFGDKGKEMGISEIRDMMKKLRQLSVARVVITGGEPMLRDDLEEVVRVTCAEKLVVSLLTNGTLSSRERMKRLIDAGVSALGISLDTLDASWEDKFCGKTGTWKAAVAALKDGVALLPTGWVYAMCTVTRENMHEVPRLVDFVEKEIGAFTVVNAVNLPASAEDVRRLSMNRPDLGIAKEEASRVDAVYGELLSMKKAGRPILVSSKFLATSRDYLKGGSMEWKCDAGTLYFNVSSDGGVAPCNEYPATINVKEPDFVARFRGDGWRQHSRDLRDRCPGCVLSCWREMSSLKNDRRVAFEQSRMLLRKHLGRALGGARTPQPA